jgi:glycosyltransferase involved in cell wall biosynthesis
VKLTFAIQRYGEGIAGGAEAHCRSLCERLARDHDVRVLTTCARDYVTWENHFPPGESELSGVRVTRFVVRQPRHPKRFAEASDRVFGPEPHADADEQAWARENGPDAPALVSAIAAERDAEALVFYSWRYAHCLAGLPRVKSRAVLVPTAEDEPAIDLALAGRLFTQPAGFLFLTPEEQALVERSAARFGGRSGAAAVIGGGVDIPTGHATVDPRARFGLGEPYLLYLGRLDLNKGVDRLLEYHEWMGADAPLLVLCGHDALGVPDHPRRRKLGFVAEEEKYALLREAAALVMPSRYESLSLVVLEAFALGRPVLADAACAPVRGLVERSGGGLTFDDGLGFDLCLRRLMADAPLRERLGARGRAFAARECDWDAVARAAEGLIARVAALGNAGRAV